MDREIFRLMDEARKEALDKKTQELEESLKKRLDEFQPVGTLEMRQEAMAFEEQKLRKAMDEERTAYNQALEAAIFENYEGSRQVALNLVREAEFKAFQQAKAEEILENEYAADQYDGDPLSSDYNKVAEQETEKSLSNNFNEATPVSSFSSDFNQVSDGPDV